MGQLTLAGSTIITSAEGVWRLSPGMMPRTFSFRQLARGVGEVAKDLGGGGCDHSVDLTFLNVAAASVQTIWDRLQNMLSPTSGSPSSGTMTCTGYPSFAHCVLTAVQPDAQTARVLEGSAGTLYGDQVYDMHFTLTFRQVRR